MSGSSRSESFTGTSYTGTGSYTRTDSIYSDSLCTEDEAEDLEKPEPQRAVEPEPKVETRKELKETPKKTQKETKIEKKKEPQNETTKRSQKETKVETEKESSTKKSSKKSRKRSKDQSQKEAELEAHQPFKWGFTLCEVYRSAVRFYKDKEGRAFNLAYEDKVKLAALTKQVTYGPCASCKKQQEIGYFDWFGKDRQNCWTELGEMKKEEAMTEMIHLVDKAIPVFSPYMVAQQKEKEEIERIRREEEEKKRLEELRRQEEEARKQREEEERIRAEEEEKRKIDMEKQEQEDQKAEMERQKIISGLNAQTAAQFSQYAAQQHPGDREAQKALIDHLQLQHYEQYMAQLSLCDKERPVPSPVQIPSNEVRIEAPSLWTRPQIRELKDQLRKDTESVLTVGRGEVVTVRVPTHEEGAYLFWEFATDSYDLGFGVYFEWSDVTTHQVSIAVNESSDDEYYPESDEEDDGNTHHGDAENGGHRRSNRPPTDEIVPVYRRDCHQQVHAGSHQYPGSGVYLLKFDNSYSLWRSKTLYYRVYYTR